jgi:hypothetical protein
LDWVIRDEAEVPLAVRNLASGHLKPTERVVHFVQKSFKDAGRTVLRVVAADLHSGEVRKLDLDTTGALVDYRAESATDSAVGRSVRGNLTPALHGKALAAASSDNLPVKIYYQHPTLPSRTALRDPASSASAWAQTAAALGPNGDAIALGIKARGGVVTGRAEHAPIIEACLPKTAILGYLAYHPLIRSVDVGGPRPATVSSPGSTAELGLWSAFYSVYPGYFGDGVSVGLVDPGLSSLQSPGAHCSIGHNWFAWEFLFHEVNPRPCTVDADCAACDWFDGSAWDRGRCYQGRCVAGHATKVAGMIGNFENPGSTPYYPRGAPKVGLNLPNHSTSHYRALDFLDPASPIAVEPFRNWTDPMAQDHYALAGGMTILHSAGNENSLSPDCVALSPICIGGYTTYWGGVQWYSSSYLNFSSCPGPSPSGCDREVPDITFKAELCATTATTNFDSYSSAVGTSQATGAAASLVALMMDRWPATYLWSPEAVKAALMAGSDSDVQVEQGYVRAPVWDAPLSPVCSAPPSRTDRGLLSSGGQDSR